MIQHQGHALWRPRAAATPIAVAAAATLAALAGVWSAHVVAPAHRAPAITRVVRIGPAQLAVPRDWQPAPLPRGGVAGRDVAFATTPGLPASALVAFAPDVEPSLIPPQLRSAFPGRVPAPARTRLAGWPAWTYRDITGGRADTRTDLTVLPTTVGVLAIACTTLAESAAGGGCASQVASVAVRGGRPFVPSPSLTLQLRLPTVLDELNRTRLRHRAALSGARSPAAQAIGARRLAADNRRTAEAIRAVGGPAGAPLMRDLAGAAGAYDALGEAAETASPDAFAAARGAVHEAEAQLASDVRAVPPPALARIAHPTPTRPVRAAHGDPGGVPPLLSVLLILLAVAAGVATSVTGTASRLWRTAGVSLRATLGL